MSRNLLKGGYVIVAQDEKITIDCNETIAKKLEALSLQKIQEHQMQQTTEEGFVEGIDPFQVAQLTEDNVNTPEQISNEVLQQEQEILRSANEEAEVLLSNANQQANDIKTKAKEEGYQEGHAEGLSKAEEEIEQQKQELAFHYQELESKLNAEYTEKKEQLESELVRILTDIYSHVLGISLQDQENLILNLLRKTMAQMDSSNHYIIHVGHDDIMNLKEAKEELSKASGIPVDHMEIIEDNTVGNNGCMIESDFGIFDCGLDTQLNLLRRQLCLLSYQKPEE